VRSKVEHSFRVLKWRFAYMNTRILGPVRNTVSLMTLFALSNLWMVR